MCKDSNDTVAREPYLSTLLCSRPRRRDLRGLPVARREGGHRVERHGRAHLYEIHKLLLRLREGGGEQQALLLLNVHG